MDGAKKGNYHKEVVNRMASSPYRVCERVLDVVSAMLSLHETYGQLSGMVEPIFGVLGALSVSMAVPALPYALSFAAGAMIYVVVDDIIPEANTDVSANTQHCKKGYG
ncbi:unnamed protein product [Phaedon cochleariae]|uniref:Uncharacterized protein n=1 Tax=Phaedon cochleariae TaxID=80249 RepID=A0A9N9SJA9_PHACE|nr:unnamed protein product [Phaedon cochleariae]